MLILDFRTHCPKVQDFEALFLEIVFTQDYFVYLVLKCETLLRGLAQFSAAT